MISQNKVIFNNKILNLSIDKLSELNFLLFLEGYNLPLIENIKDEFKSIFELILNLSTTKLKNLEIDFISLKCSYSNNTYLVYILSNALEIDKLDYYKVITYNDFIIICLENNKFYINYIVNNYYKKCIEYFYKVYFKSKLNLQDKITKLNIDKAIKIKNYNDNLNLMYDKLQFPFNEDFKLLVNLNNSIAINNIFFYNNSNLVKLFVSKNKGLIDYTNAYNIIKNLSINLTYIITLDKYCVFDINIDNCMLIKFVEKSVIKYVLESINYKNYTNKDTINCEDIKQYIKSNKKFSLTKLFVYNMNCNINNNTNILLNLYIYNNKDEIKYLKTNKNNNKYYLAFQQYTYINPYNNRIYYSKISNFKLYKNEFESRNILFKNKLLSISYTIDEYYRLYINDIISNIKHSINYSQQLINIENIYTLKVYLFNNLIISICIDLKLNKKYYFLTKLIVDANTSLLVINTDILDNFLNKDIKNIFSINNTNKSNDKRIIIEYNDNLSKIITINNN